MSILKVEIPRPQIFVLLDTEMIFKLSYWFYVGGTSFSQNLRLAIRMLQSAGILSTLRVSLKI